ncbi:hypothetical protein VCRA2133E348_50108 [Vibrio crassostreae]|nr:hypothetical protein VCRA2133E348_50108 [Vibrio crassostreae]CAK3555561.1 hypothetical protein VCRA213O314_50062 [Vibrio crassostreae]
MYSPQYLSLPFIHLLSYHSLHLLTLYPKITVFWLLGFTIVNFRHKKSHIQWLF